MTTATMGWESKYCAEPGAAPHVFDTGSELYEFNEFGVRREDEILDTDGIRATRSPHSINTRLGKYTVGGVNIWCPTVADLVLWLPRILGANASGTTFALDDALPSFGLLHSNGVDTFEYTDCMVNKATFTIAAGELVRLALEIFGKTEVIGTSFPVLSLGTTALSNSPFVASDVTATLVSALRDTLTAEITIDNMIERRWSMGSRSATSLKPKGRITSVKTTHPYIAALYNQAVGGTAGTIAATNSTVSLSFAFATIQVPPIGSTINSKGETVLECNGVARMTGSTREVIVTLDSTP